MITKEKRKEYRSNFRKKLGEEEYIKYIASQSRKYYLKNLKNKSAVNKAWRESHPEYSKMYYHYVTKK